MRTPTGASIAIAIIGLCAMPTWAQDADGDTIPDAIEAQIATDPRFPEPLELLYEDGSGEADTSIGAECVPYGDYTHIWFAPVARGRYLFRIDLAGETQWPPASHDVRILYVDADNDQTTGRPDAGPGCDIMFYLSPTRENRLIGWNRPVASVAAADGRSIYVVVDVNLNQQDGRSVFRLMLLYQDMREEHRQNRDSMPWTEVTAAGESDRQRIEVATDHPLYRPPQEVRSVGARVLFDRPQPRAEITLITELPTIPSVEYGATADYGSAVEAEHHWNNHRIWLEDLEEGREYHYRVRVPDRDGDIVTEDATFSTVRPEPVIGTVERDAVMLTVRNPHPAAAESTPITTGLPFPRGALGDDAHLRLLDADGRELPLQTEVTARWQDGSVQWVLLDFLATVPAQSRAQFAVEYGSAVERTVRPEGITIERAGDALIVDTGVVEAIINPESSERVLATLDEGLGDRLTVNLPVAAICVVDEAGFGSMGDTMAVEIEREGPLAVVVKVSGPHENQDGETLFRYVSRYHFTAGSGLVRLQHTVENDQVDQTLTRIDQYMIGLRVFPGEDATVTVEGGEDGPVSFAARDGHCVLNQDLDNHWSLTCPGVEREGERGPAAIDVSDEARGLWVGLRHFWQKWPSELVWHYEAKGLGINLLPEFDDDRYAEPGDAIESDRLYYHVRDGGYRLHWGMSFTREIWLGFHEGNAWPDAWAQQLREPLIAVAEPEWYCASGAFGEQLPRTEGLFPEYEEMVGRIFDLLMQRRENNRSYGFLNFGDWWGERGFNWGNMEYDTPHAQMVQFIRTGERKFFDEACNSATHNRDVDYIHHAPNPGDVGKTRAHRMFHTGGYEPRMTKEQMGLAYANDGGITGPLSGHQWNRGKFDHYFMTGEERSRRVALGLAEFMAGPGSVSFTIGRGAERCVAWAIYDVISAYRVTWDPFYLNAARIMVEDVIRKQTPEGHWAMPAGYSDVEPTPIGGYAWCSGLLITMLEEYNRYARDPRVDETIMNAARWLVRDEYVPQAKGFRSCSCDTFNERTRPGHSAWAVANAMAHAYELSGDERYLDLAQMTYAYFAEGAGGMGKSYSIALVTSPHLIYKLHEAGRDDIDTARWEEPFEAVVPRVLAPGAGRLSLLLRTRRREPVQVTVAAGNQKREITLQPDADWEVVTFQAAGPDVIEGKIVCGEQTESFRVEALHAGKIGAPRDGVGLIAGEEDFLGPALEALGVEFEVITGLTDLERFGTIYLGTQACTLDAAGVRTSPAPLVQWLHAGGTVVISHPNDEAWDPFLLGPPLVLQEENSISGAIVAPDHPLLAGLDAQALAGAMMYDSVSFADGAWQVLVEDRRGRPAVLELQAGEGHALVIVPSFERYVTAALAADAEQVARYRAFMENVLAWVVRR